MSLNTAEKINFIKNNFHQYFDLTLNKNIQTNDYVNLVIPISDLQKGDTVTSSFYHSIIYPDGYNIDSILSKYNDTTYTKEELVPCFCTEVIDGDTIDISRISEENNQVIYHPEERVRLVGVNTPEFGATGYDVSKEFMKKVCLNKKIYLKIDDNRLYDRDTNSKRLRAVVIYNNKNINEILLKEGLAEIMYIPPSISPFEWANPDTKVHIYKFTNADITIAYPYFNSEMTNIVFTPANDLDTIYRYEIYNGIIFLRMKPFSSVIRMHLLPKGYDCSDNLLIFKDSMIKPENIKKSNDYTYKPESSYINSYYLKNNNIRDRDNPSISSEKYNADKWYNTFCDFSYDISKDTKSFNNLQICAGYRYNQSTPYYSVHYTGVRDNTNLLIEDRCTLIDANYDKIENISNNITQYKYNTEKELYIPKKPRLIRATYNNNINHVNEINQLHHKIIKYINDSLYSEEDMKGSSTKKYVVTNWVDISEED